jgi:alkylation response protein AidB-like acyl-CoA dehydrogenase
VSTSETQDMLSQAVEQLLDRYHSAQSKCEGKPQADLWPQLVELGLTAAEFAEENGGLGVPFADLAPAFQTIGRALATSYLTEFTIMGGWLTNACAASAMVPQIASGEARVALAFGEYGIGGNVGFTTSVAIPGASGWSLSGRKSVVVGGDRASHLIVPAKLADGEMALFLLPTDTVGLNRQAYQLYDSCHAADFDLAGVTLPADSLLARGTTAIDLIELALDRGRAALCHEAVGLLEVVQEITLDYVKTRKQFGQTIGEFQTMQHRMSDMYMDIELARSCALLATDAISEDGDSRERMQTVSAAMVSMSECARRVGQSAVQAHGGIALTQEYIVGHYFKRLTMVARYLGDADFHRERYIALDPR